jgi:hypothetical protein
MSVMQLSLSRPEKILLAFCATLFLVAVFGPAVAQPAHFHAFADQRALWGIPCALDVLSNLPFALFGLLGFGWQSRVPASALAAGQRAMATLFFAGLLVTAAASGYYHWQPDNASLAIDRAGMLVAFAGLLGLGAGGRISERAGHALAAAVLLLGAASVALWSVSGNLLPWALLQGGGMLLVLGFAACQPRNAALAVRWAAVMAIYAVAKLLELGDGAVFAASGEWVSGHTLKHLVASLAAWPVLSALQAAAISGQNRSQTAAAPLRTFKTRASS